MNNNASNGSHTRSGIIRRVDELGRIILPKDVRRSFNITEGTPMEIFVEEDGIKLKRYIPRSGISDILQNLSEVTRDDHHDGIISFEQEKSIQKLIRDIRAVLKSE